MSSEPDEGPVYYREIQKHAYLKRVPNEDGTSKLRALGQKKAKLKPMWTLFCVHNGTTPYLEQYPAAECTATLAHRPEWRACLLTARHVTAGVRARAGDQHDFLVDTEAGPVRMRAPDWDSMQEWVTTLRDKLYELRIVSRGQNVYAAPPAAPPPRAAARDPTSPLPPTPPHPPQRVPGIELHTPTRQIAANETTANSENVQNSTATENGNETQASSLTTSSHAENSMNPSSSSENDTSAATSAPANTTQQGTNGFQCTQNPIGPQSLVNNGPCSMSLPAAENVDISNWDPTFSTLPSTSRGQTEPNKSVAKICGQNVCLDDSILKRPATDSDEEFFAEIDRIHDSMEDLCADEDFGKYKQRVMVTGGERVGLSRAESLESKPERTNVTVIQVSNKPPHTAIPVIGSDADVFDFNFRQQLKITEANRPQDNFINIVNTESHLTGNGYGTVFTAPDSDYGHLSLTTTVNVNSAVKVTESTVKVTDDTLTDVKTTDGVYERLCLASTSSNDEIASPLSVRRIKMAEKVRKSSLPNLELAGESTTYEYVFPNSPSQNTTVTVSDSSVRSRSKENSRLAGEIQTNVNDNRVQSRSNSQHRSPARRAQVNLDSNARTLSSNVERSQSQNAYDAAPRRDVRRVPNNSPKRDGKGDKTEVTHPKPIWKRGLTELSLLSRLRGLGQGKRQEGAPARGGEADDRIERLGESPVKVVRRSRPEVRIDSTRRRSSSLSNNGQSPPYAAPPPPQSLQPLRARQAAALRAEQRRGACVAAVACVADPPVLCEYDRMVWVARWGRSGERCGGRQGDRVASLARAPIVSVQQARLVFKSSRTPLVGILFHRVPLGKIYVINRRENESLGIKLDSELTITSVEAGSPAARAGVPPPGKWCVTEVNNRPVNLVKGGEEEFSRLCSHGAEVSVLIQPAALVKRMRAAIKSSRPLLGIR